MKNNTLYISIAAIVILGMAIWVAAGYIAVNNIEKPKYQVVEEKDGYEVRKYSSYLIAEYEVEGDYQKALNEGFKNLADYIFGNNSANEEIAMTAPVTSKEKGERDGEAMAMTAPVTLKEASKGYVQSFVIPSKYTLENVPKPNNKKIKIREVPERVVAVLSYSGFFNEKNYKKHEKMLIEKLEKDEIHYEETFFAGYNPPFTAPFMRVNEVWAILK